MMFNAGIIAFPQLSSDPVDPDWSSVVSLLQFESNTTTDGTGRSWTATGVTHNTVSPISGVGSVSITADGSYSVQSSSASADFDFGTSTDFTIEIKSQFASGTDRQYLCDIGFNTGAWILTPSTGGVELFSGSFIINGAGAHTLERGTGRVYDLCLERHGTTWRVYVDGAVFASATSSAIWGSNAKYTWFNYGGGGFQAAGTFDEMRITRGVARYQGAYTPSAEPFPNQ
jgi:hypothetical protein